MKKIHKLTESDLERIVKTVLENFNPSEYEDEDFVEVFLNYFRPWVRKKHGDEIGQYPLSLLIKNHINEFSKDYGLEDVNARYYGAYRNMSNIGKEERTELLANETFGQPADNPVFEEETTMVLMPDGTRAKVKI